MTNGVNTVAGFLTDFSSRIKNLEERYTLLRERLLVLTQTVIKRERELKKEIQIIEDELKEMKRELKESSSKIDHLIKEMPNFARSDELRVLEKYFKMWEPVKFARIEDVERVVDEKLKRRKMKE